MDEAQENKLYQQIVNAVINIAGGEIKPIEDRQHPGVYIPNLCTAGDHIFVKNGILHLEDRSGRGIISAMLVVLEKVTGAYMALNRPGAKIPSRLMAEDDEDNCYHFNIADPEKFAKALDSVGRHVEGYKAINGIEIG